MASKLRQLLDAQGRGSVGRLAKKIGRHYTFISKAADGHRVLSLPEAIKITDATGIPERDLYVPRPKPTAGKPRRKSTPRGR